MELSGYRQANLAGGAANARDTTRVLAQRADNALGRGLQRDLASQTDARERWLALLNKAMQDELNRLRTEQFGQEFGLMQDRFDWEKDMAPWQIGIGGVQAATGLGRWAQTW